MKIGPTFQYQVRTHATVSSQSHEAVRTINLPVSTQRIRSAGPGPVRTYERRFRAVDFSMRPALLSESPQWRVVRSGLAQIAKYQSAACCAASAFVLPLLFLLLFQCGGMRPSSSDEGESADGGVVTLGSRGLPRASTSVGNFGKSGRSTAHSAEIHSEITESDEICDGTPSFGGTGLSSAGMNVGNSSKIGGEKRREDAEKVDSRQIVDDIVVAEKVRSGSGGDEVTAPSEAQVFRSDGTGQEFAGLDDR